MRIELNTETEINNYFQYLLQSKKLHTKYPIILLEEKESIAYLTFTSNSNITTPEVTKKVNVVPNLFTGTPIALPSCVIKQAVQEKVEKELAQVNKHWTGTELDLLSIEISKGSTPNGIAILLSRTEDGVRHKARTLLNLVYNKGKWRDTNYLKE